MPIKDDLNKVVSSVKLDSLIGNPLESINSNSKELFVQFQKFRKLLSQCNITDGMSVDSILTDIKSIVLDGQNISGYLTNPNKIACFATAILGLETFASDEIVKIKNYIKDYKIGFLPFMEDIFKTITTEFNPKNISIDFTKVLNEASSTLIDVGAGFVLSQVEEKINTAENFIQNKIDNHFSKIGKYLSFLMVASAEFKWAMYLIYIENLKSQTQGRIDKLINLKNSIRNLVYEIDSVNKTYETTDFSNTLENYIGVLTVLEASIELNKNIEDDMNNYNIFNQLINDNLIGNLDTAKKLLIGQRDSFLEKITESKEPIYNNDISFRYLLPNDISKFSGIVVLNNITPLDTSKFLEKFDTISGLFIQDDSPQIFYNTTSDYVKQLNLTGKTYVELYSPLPESTEYFKLNKYIYKVISVSAVDPTLNKFMSGFSDKTAAELIYIYEIELVNRDYYISPNIPSIGNIIPYFILTPNDFILEPVLKTIELTDDSYVITESKGNKYQNSILIKQSGLEKIKSVYGEDRTWNVVAFLNYIDNKIIIMFSGEMPSFPEKLEENATIKSDLPESYNTIFNQYANTDNLNLNDITNINGTISNFLYGKDLLTGSLDKYGNNLSSYSEFIKTGGTVLEAFCPLKNSLHSYYSLLQQLTSLKKRDEDITNKISRDWILKINRIIEDTLKNMTARDIDGQYLKINEIKGSSVYYKLLPSIILDYDNLTNINKLASFNNTIGKIFNINTTIANKLTEFDSFLQWIETSNKLENLRNTEKEMWTQISSTFVNSLNLLLKGENVTSLKDIFDNIEIKIDDLTIELADLYDRLASFNVEDFSSQNKLLDLLKSTGLEHWGQYLKEGKFDIFIKEKTSSWVGKYGPAIECLTSIANKYFSGFDKNFLIAISNYLSYIDVNRLLSLIELGDLNMSLSIDTNFLNKVPTETINNLKNTAKNISFAKAAESKIKKQNDK